MCLSLGEADNRDLDINLSATQEKALESEVQGESG